MWVMISIRTSLQNLVCLSRQQKKLSHHGRFSGGVIALIRKSLVSYMKRIDTETDSAIVFRIAEQLFGKAKPIVMVFTYLPPTQSSYYDHIQNGYGVELL